MIGVELRMLLARPRTWVTLALLDLLPVVVAVLLAVTRVGPRPGEGPPFLAAVLTNGTLYPAAALALVLPLFLPVAVAVVAGDAVAGEAQAGTLRYLLVRPVSRSRLLLAKLVSVMVFTVTAVVLVAFTGFLLGRLLPTAPTGVVSLSGGPPLNSGETVLRTVLAVGYVGLSMLGVAAFALLLSTLTDSPLAAALGALALLVVSTALVGLDSAQSLSPYLPTRYWLAFVDLFRTPILWRDLVRGASLQAVYVGVLLIAAWANFTTKDITS